MPAGKTRPKTDHVKLSASKAAPLQAPAMVAQLAEPLANASTAAAVIRRLNVPFLDETSSSRARDAAAVVAKIRDLRTALPADGASVSAIETNVRRFHAEIERAFSIALSGSAAESSPRAIDASAVAAKARAILLEEVLFHFALAEKLDLPVALLQQRRSVFETARQVGRKIGSHRFDDGGS